MKILKMYGLLVVHTLYLLVVLDVFGGILDHVDHESTAQQDGGLVDAVVFVAGIAKVS